MHQGSGMQQGSSATGNQFKAAVFFAAPAWGKFPVHTEAKQKPSITGSYALQHTRIGNAYFGRNFQYKFGSVISPPSVDVNANSLTGAQTPLNYWNPKPYNAYKADQEAEDEYGRFYWGEDQKKLYATRPGPVEIIWVKNTPVGPGNQQHITGAACP